MSFEKIEHQNESLFHKRISQLLYPLIFSLFFTLNGYGQPKDSKITSDQKSVNQIETLQDSSFIKIFKNILNKLIKPEFSDLEKDRLINDFIMGLDFYFNESNDTLYTIKRENMYIKRRGLIEPLEGFLRNFYKESYRSTGTLSVKILSIYKQNKKIYVSIEYIYQKDPNK